MKTKLSIDGTKFLINGSLTYSEYPDCPEKYKGLLMNARFIQGVFDDKMEPERFNRFGKKFEAGKKYRKIYARHYPSGMKKA